MKLIQQNNKSACVAACMAMICHEVGAPFTQEQIQYEFKLLKAGTDLLSEMSVWSRLGFFATRHDHLKPELILSATVPSLNIVGGNHRVIFDLREYHKILDPNTGLKGVKFYESFDQLRGWSELLHVDYVGSAATHDPVRIKLRRNESE